MIKPAKYLLIGAFALAASVWTLDASAQEKPKDPPVTSQDAKKDVASPEKDKDNPENDPLIVLAKEYFSKGDIAKCRETLEKAVKKNPLLPPHDLMLARLLLSTRDQQMVQSGRTLLEIVIANNPQNPEVYLTNGQIALAEGRITEALYSFSLALQHADGEKWSETQRNTFLTGARIGLATVFEARKDWGNAKTHLRHWLELDPKNNEIRQRLARALFLTGRNQDRVDSLKHLKDAYEKDPTMEPPLVQLGMLAVQLIGQEIKEPGPNKQPENYYKDMANSYFKRALEEYANDPKKLVKVHQALAGWKLDTRDKTGDKISAKEEISKILEIEKSAHSRATMALLGLQARYNRDFEAAEKVLTTLVSLYPGDFFGQNSLALVLAELNDPEAKKHAVAMADANARQNSRSPEAYATLAWCLFKVGGRQAEAEKAIQAAISNGQASPDTAYYLSEILNSKKEYEKAYENLEKALKSEGVFVNREEAAKLETPLKLKAEDEKRIRVAKEKLEKQAAAIAEKEALKEKEKNKEKPVTPEPKPKE